LRSVVKKKIRIDCIFFLQLPYCARSGQLQSPKGQTRHCLGDLPPVCARNSGRSGDRHVGEEEPVKRTNSSTTSTIRS
jgi:hypothetical protein